MSCSSSVLLSYTIIYISAITTSTLLQKILQRLPQHPTLLLLDKVHHVAIPHHIQELRLLRIHRQPLATRLNLANCVPIASRLQVAHIGVWVAAGARKGGPVVDGELHEGEVVGVAEGKADADDVAEVVGEVAGVAFEVFVCVGERSVSLGSA